MILVVRMFLVNRTPARVVVIYGVSLQHRPEPSLFFAFTFNVFIFMFMFNMLFLFFSLR